MLLELFKAIFSKIDMIKKNEKRTYREWENFYGRNIYTTIEAEPVGEILTYPGQFVKYRCDDQCHY